MPAYEYHCRECDETFEVRRAMSDSADASAVTCPSGHADVRRRFSVFAAVGGASASAFGDSSMPAPSGGGGGGCCGGGCGCR